MKVLQLGGLAGPRALAGGVWSVARTQTRALTQRGHAVSLVGSWLGSPPQTGDVQLLRAWRPFPGAKLRGLLVPEGARVVRDHAAKVDIAHVHLSRDSFTTRALRVLDHAGVPLVIQPHGMIAPPSKITTKLFDAAHASFFCSVNATWLALTDIEIDSLTAFGVAPERIRRVANAAQDPEERWSCVDGVARFSFISRLHPRKQPEVFAEAARLLLSQGHQAKFVMAGPNQGAETLARQVMSAEIESGVAEFRGPLTASEVSRELASTTALVLPSRGEVAPMIAIEAAALGTPIILTEDCGLAKLFAEAEAALVVKPTAQEVARAMIRLLEEPGLAGELSRKARRLYEGHWSPSRLGQRLEEIYEATSEETRIFTRRVHR